VSYHGAVPGLSLFPASYTISLGSFFDLLESLCVSVHRFQRNECLIARLFSSVL